MEHLIPSMPVVEVLEGMRNVALTSGGIAIDATPADIETANTIVYTIQGQFYSKVAITAIDLSASAIAGTIIPDNYKAAMLLLLDAAGNPVMKISANVLIADKITIPAFDLNTYTCVGAVMVANDSGSNFVVGTTSLATANVTDTYINVFNALPGEIPAWG